MKIRKRRNANRTHNNTKFPFYLDKKKKEINVLGIRQQAEGDKKLLLKLLLLNYAIAT